MGRDFSALNKYGRREYKFAQADSYGQINAEVMGTNYSDNLQNGVCMGVVLNWTKEKLATSNGLFRRDGPLLNPTTKRFSNPLFGESGPRNESTMLAGAMTHLAYVAKSRGTVARELGLIEGAHDPRPTVRQGDGNIPGRIEDSTIAAAGTGLPKGNAIVVELEQDDGSGHAIAFYRSRGGTLYFFDPNAGVYEVFESNILNFVQAWLEVYVRENSITWKTAARDWCAVYNRTGT